VALPVLAATLTTIVVFFPVTLLFGVSKFLFTALALAVVISLAASYFVALTVVPLFCARFLHISHANPDARDRPKFSERVNQAFGRGFDRMLLGYRALVGNVLAFPRLTLAVFAVAFVLSLLLFPLLDLSFFPRTDAGQFVITLKAPSGTNLTETEKEVARVEDIVHQVVSPDDLRMVVSNIGVDPGFSAIYTTNSAMHTAFVQVDLKPGHHTGSFAYIDSVKARLDREMPELATFFSSGSLVDAVLNMGMQAPIDIQVAGTDQKAGYRVALDMMSQIRRMAGVADVYIPQDIDNPALRLDIDRVRAGELGLSEKEVVGNVITALTSNQMIAPNIWIDPRNNNNYFLNVQYREGQIRGLDDLRSIPLRGPKLVQPTRLDMVSHITRIEAPTEVDHYQIRRTLDIYVRPEGEDLGRIADSITKMIAQTKMPQGIEAFLRGSVEAMRASLRSFALGLSLSVVLLYLVLVAQFRSFTDPFLILLAFPPGITGALFALWFSHTPLNVMSLMGLVMLAGVTMSNSILIVEFAHHLVKEGHEISEAVVTSCAVRLRPILMTTFATMIGLLPMALKMGEGSESYAPLALVLVGGLGVSVVATVFIVPAGFLLAYRRG
jgi:multidrug efflux pump subunit AcrB